MVALIIVGSVMLALGLILAIIGIVLYENNVRNKRDQQWYVYLLIAGGIIMAIAGGVMLGIGLSNRSKMRALLYHPPGVHPHVTGPHYDHSIYDHMPRSDYESLRPSVVTYPEARPEASLRPVTTAVAVEPPAEEGHYHYYQ
jgi:hypothetical protein